MQYVQSTLPPARHNGSQIYDLIHILQANYDLTHILQAKPEVSSQHECNKINIEQAINP